MFQASFYHTLPKSSGDFFLRSIVILSALILVLLASVWMSLNVCFYRWQCKFRFVQLLKYSPNSRRRHPSCLLAVFAMFLAIISPSSSCSSYSWNEWSVRQFSFHNESNPGLLVNGALTCRRLHFSHHFLIKHKILPNLVISNWLWWIVCVLLANRNWGKYFEWII